jgi:hypothetical protein
MNPIGLADLQASIQDRSGFTNLEDYLAIGCAFLDFVAATRPTRIVSPAQSNYIFYQYAPEFGHKITRPLNHNLFDESSANLKTSFERFVTFLGDVRKHQAAITALETHQAYIASKEINRVVYTIQQAIGCIGDSLDNPNQTRKRVGQLFEILVKLLIQQVGLDCEPRTITLPIPGYPDYTMSYQLDLVFSRNQAIIASETKFVHPSEVVGSVKTTSKDRIDKIFLDKHLLTKLLQRDVPVIAIFLHDVQRARRGESIFGINSTFKSNHFLGYTVAFNKLDGVYYVDPRPEMTTNARLREQIRDFQQFLIHDLWTLSKPSA